MGRALGVSSDLRQAVRLRRPSMPTIVSLPFSQTSALSSLSGHDYYLSMLPFDPAFLAVRSNTTFVLRSHPDMPQHLRQAPPGLRAFMPRTVP